MLLKNFQKKISIITNPKPLEQYIDKPEKVAQQALNEQSKSMAFIKTYRS